MANYRTKIDTVKVFNLLKSIQEMIARTAHQAPYLLSIGERAEAIAQAYQLGLQATQEALASLEDLIREINLAEGERNQMSLKPESFAIYWLLNRDGMPNAEWIARQMEDAFNKYPHWHLSSAQERDVRTALYIVLLRENTQASAENRDYKEISQLTAQVDQIMKIAGRAKEAV